MESSEGPQVSKEGDMRSSQSKLPEYFKDVKIEDLSENCGHLPADDELVPDTIGNEDTVSWSQFDQLRDDLSGLLDEIDQSSSTRAKRSKKFVPCNLFKQLVAVDEGPIPSTHTFALPTLNQVPSCGLGYFSLSREIRDMIMELVLCPGHIYFPPPTSPNQSPELRPKSHYGFQLLATCQQAYEEGHKLYYASNIFHLPPGPFVHTLNILQSIQPMHLDLIKKFVIDLNFVDLWGCDMTQVCSDAVKRMKDVANRIGKPLCDHQKDKCIFIAVWTYLLREWEYKVIYMERQLCFHRVNFWIEVNVPPPDEDWQYSVRPPSSRPLQRSQFIYGFDPLDPPDFWVKPVDPNHIASWFKKIEGWERQHNCLERWVARLFNVAHYFTTEYVSNKLCQVGWKGLLLWLEKKSSEVYEQHVQGIYRHPEQWYRDVFDDDTLNLSDLFGQ